ncbi:MAG: hypothetical protein HeimC3_46830 [Candidatus Heimdallarchaeota archaeon LC_3]|nr:MAG: hypothetical protein HeimC3_46830 [Candidatus Heimdallarchaeota archaeon LC_3]
MNKINLVINMFKMVKGKNFCISMVLFLVVISLEALSVSPSISQEYNGKELTETDPMIFYVNKNFQESQIDSNPMDFDESAKFVIESKSGNIFTIYWEHNGSHLHSYITTQSTGHIALGWKLEKPANLGVGVMENSNIIIGQQFANGTQQVRDHFGIIGNHFADTVLGGTDDLVFSSIINKDSAITLEFVYPLITTDTASTDTGNLVDVNLPLDFNNWAYFLISASDITDENFITYHEENRHIISRPVYLQKNEEDSYPNFLKDADYIIQKSGTMLTTTIAKQEMFDLQDSQVDVQIVIEAQLTPWTNNVTVYQNKGFDPELEFIDPKDAYARIPNVMIKNQLANSSISSRLNFTYLNDIDYGGLITPNISVFTNQVVRFVFKALDTEHGIVLGETGDPELDVFSNPFARTFPQGEIIVMYWQAPSEPKTFEYRCTFFCGAGHVGMFGSLYVLEPSEGIFIITTGRLIIQYSEGIQITTFSGISAGFLILITIILFFPRRKRLH